MAPSDKQIDVYIETGSKRTFASAVLWPGWSRSGRDESSALQQLAVYGSRYASVVRTARLGFPTPVEPSAFIVIERLSGNASTDFGAPGAAPSCDAQPLDDKLLRRYQAILKACWKAFDAAVLAAAGHELSKGPRGGGRDTAEIVEHVMNAERAYLGRIAWKLEDRPGESASARHERTLQEVLAALKAAAHGRMPAAGPRGGTYWSPGYFTRRVAWHVLDHAWEIEDRIM